ncbi:MAG: RIP metalloprotease RseP [Alphaproteobacteria bacterium]|nr:RIP metalloprotease RseP [Alphaproteobacteria bacterium SS10]
MEQFFGGALSVVEYGVAFVLVLSVLVFIHEWGHYFVARRCGVKIESFSIGFGPEIFGFTDKAGTRWRFSIIPLGGYVKMFGDADPASMPTEAAAKMTEEDREGSFFHKTVGQRSAIVFAGPAANFIFAIIVFTGMFMVAGETFTPARISGVVDDTPAAAAGLQAGDTVVSVDGRRIDRFETLQQVIRINAGHEIQLVVERNGEEISMPLTPAVRVIDDGFGGKGQIGVMGVYGPTAPARIGELEPDSRAEAAGLEPGDMIVEVDGQLVQNAREVINQIEDKAEQTVTLTVLRGVDSAIIGPNEAPADSLTLSIEIAPTAFDLNAPAEGEGESSDDSAPEQGADVAENSENIVGSLPGISWTPLPNTTRVYSNPFHAVYRASVSSYEMGANTLTALWQLVSGQRSVKELGGPLKIARISGDVAQQNVMALLHFMVLLSINLGLINLLPVPVLDGGHLVFYAIEALRGKPVGLKAQEYCFRVGLALILCLMIFATWNDVMQMFVNNA